MELSKVECIGGKRAMGSASNIKEHTVASEIYAPALNDQYNNRFLGLLQQMSHTLPTNRTALIKHELSEVDIETAEDRIEALKYAASLNVLIDLSFQGWIFEVENGTLILKMEIENLDDKQKLRYRLSAERNAQFKSESIAAFIRKMEAIKEYQGVNISIRNLIGDASILVGTFRIMSPYASRIFN